MSKRKTISTRALKRTEETWRRMILRCNDPTHAAHDKFSQPYFYVCERWRDFDAFVEDMGPRPGMRLIERVDKTRGYEPGNCRWSDREESPWANARDPVRSGDTLVQMLISSIKREEAQNALWFWSV